MTRCDLSDLPVEMCACRIHGPADEPARIGSSGGEVPPEGVAFTAQYFGVCADCRDPVHPGDRIVSDGQGGYWHQECAP
jgi:hypothetical protein